MNALCKKDKSIYFNNMRKLGVKKVGDLIKSTKIFRIETEISIIIINYNAIYY